MVVTPFPSCVYALRSYISRLPLLLGGWVSREESVHLFSETITKLGAGYFIKKRGLCSCFGAWKFTHGAGSGEGTSAVSHHGRSMSEREIQGRGQSCPSVRTDKSSVGTTLIPSKGASPQSPSHLTLTTTSHIGNCSCVGPRSQHVKPWRTHGNHIQSTAQDGHVQCPALDDGVEPTC